ncbi:hypothetical protein EDB81DRAFT_494497 [Dactylonectria macrodidyma]|uniref:Secreted protein n=1 Tax=Dactylonectria macrodidyma TaxID=307937 RepID=A0A9P9J7U2_9HYPO|nr:hypothetical protein EDB81DRAFT_494497 [Dactylonectria macrodidyma]
MVLRCMPVSFLGTFSSSLLLLPWCCDILVLASSLAPPELPSTASPSSITHPFPIPHAGSLLCQWHHARWLAVLRTHAVSLDLVVPQPRADSKAGPAERGILETCSGSASQPESARVYPLVVSVFRSLPPHTPFSASTSHPHPHPHPYPGPCHVPSSSELKTKTWRWGGRGVHHPELGREEKKKLPTRYLSATWRILHPSVSTHAHALPGTSHSTDTPTPVCVHAHAQAIHHGDPPMLPGLALVGSS